jgi:alkylated DNA repair dioxygenase AlkB
VARQLGLFSTGAPAIDESFAGLRRLDLDEGAWVEHVPDWVSGHDTLFDALERGTRWRVEERPMYDQIVVVPRLIATMEDSDGHPLLDSIRAAVSRRYGQEFVRISFALYRDGSDSVAFHGDYVARELPEALVATVSLGQPRRFLLKPARGGSSVTFHLGNGDLFVMGGSCQRTWRHSVPKVSQAGQRLAVMFRPIW